MVQVVGKYQYVSSENVAEFAKAIGQTEGAETIVNSKPVVEVAQNGDQWSITVTNEGKAATSSFKLGESYDEYLPFLGRSYKSLAVQEGENFKVETAVADDVKLVRVYEFTDSGMVVHLSTDKVDVKATRTYKRL